MADPRMAIPRSSAELLNGHAALDDPMSRSPSGAYPLLSRSHLDVRVPLKLTPR